MEIADVFVINKADRPGVDETRRDLEQMLDLSDRATAGGRRSWPTVAHQARGSRRCGTSHRRAPGLRRVGRRGRAQRRERRLRRGAGRDRRDPARGRGPASCAPARPTSAWRPTCWPAASTRGRRPTRCWARSAPERSGDVAGRVLAVGRPEASDVGHERRARPGPPRTPRRRRRRRHPRQPEGQRPVAAAVARADRGGRQELTADPPGAVVVTGGERIFAAGADITEFVGLDVGRRPRRLGVDHPGCAWTPSPPSRGW